MIIQFLFACMAAVGFTLLGVSIGLPSKPQYKRDKRGRFTK